MLYLLLQEGGKSMDGTYGWMEVMAFLGIGVKNEEKQRKYFINWKLLSYRLTQLPASPSTHCCRKFNGRPFLMGIPFQTFCWRQVSCMCKYTYRVNSTLLLE